MYNVGLQLCDIDFILFCVKNKYMCISQHLDLNASMNHIMTKPVKPYAINKDTDQSDHPHSLITVFVLDSTVPMGAVYNISFCS